MQRNEEKQNVFELETEKSGKILEFERDKIETIPNWNWRCY